ncbi:MAG: hypothetical protein HGB26_01305 [Desulfobulbaceae bacterium]|nr:hypothetical protein [Desulfobulbaceae bacterium]
MRHDQEPAIQKSAPPFITVGNLRDHFRHTYKLNEAQVETMIRSSSKSLEQGLAQLVDVLSREEPVEGLGAIYHGLKGLFLNMGEKEWAAYTKELEQKLSAGEQLDHGVIAEELRQGMGVVLAYCGTADVGSVQEGES